MMLEKYLTIFRATHNFASLGDDGRTPRDAAGHQEAPHDLRGDLVGGVTSRHVKENENQAGVQAVGFNWSSCRENSGRSVP